REGEPRGAVTDDADDTTPDEIDGDRPAPELPEVVEQLLYLGWPRLATLRDRRVPRHIAGADPHPQVVLVVRSALPHGGARRLRSTDHLDEIRFEQLA